jgi:cGMP-dependent protein kinase 2
MTDIATVPSIPEVGELSEFEIFVGLPAKLLERVRDNAPLLEAAPEEIICTEGQFGRELYLILSGYVRVSRNTETEPFLVGSLNRGDFFGAMNPQSNQVSAVSVTATTDCVLLEISHTLLQAILKSSPHAQKLVERTYNDLALRSELRHVDLFEGFSSKELDHLISKAEVVAYAKDEVIVREGDDGDAIFIVRSGFVKIVKERPEPQKDLVIAYMREGQYFGEMALLRGEKRSAWVISLNDSEVIRITKDDFDLLLDSHPVMRKQIEEVIKKRDERFEELLDDDDMADQIKFVVNEGLMQQNTALVIDMDKCIHCDNCSDACAAIHDGHSLLVRHGPQLDTVEASTLFPTSCHHCEDPLCLTGCNFNSMERSPAGEISIVEETCTGCNLCAKLCPYDTIVMVPRQSETQVGWLGRLFGSKPEPVFVPTSPTGKKYKRLAMQCDLCTGRQHMNCVYNCPTGAIFQVKPNEYFSGAESN